MRVLALDVGSSSVKAAVLRSAAAPRVVRSAFATVYDGTRAEVDPAEVLRAVSEAIRSLGESARRADVIALGVMSPSWVAMDRRGVPLTRIVIHQDRRSVEEAREIERRVGRARHLRIAGNRPFPGGISSTTLAWHLRHEPARMRRADLVGHLNTFLHRRLTGARVVDPGSASFMGLYRTLDLEGWSDELIEAVGASRSWLPEVREGSEVGGRLTSEAASLLGLPQGTPMLVGVMDTSAAMLRAGAEPGRLTNACGSTDVLALCTDRPRPHPRLLTRAMGVGRLWLSVSTIAAAGSSIAWVRRALFADLGERQFARLILCAASRRGASGVRFEPYLAGDRASIEQRKASFEGLTLAATREDMLAAVVEALCRQSAGRLELLAGNPVKLRREVVVTGGVQKGLSLGPIRPSLLHGDWPGRWRFRSEEEASVRGLWDLAFSAGRT